jgi:hypothetical protein
MVASTAVRVYLPATWDALVTLADPTSAGALTTRKLGFAVTASVREADPGGDDEEWEFVAFSDAAQASMRLLRGDLPRRRVVLSVDLHADLVDVTSGSSEVGVPDVVPRDALAAVHVDGAEAEAAVSSVLAGAPDDTLDDVALEWYLPSEVADILR